MKATDYFKIFNEENKDKSPEWRLIFALRNMVLEIETIQKARNAQTDNAMIAIFKEIERKSISFIKMINETDPFKSEGNVKNDAFKLFLIGQSPELAKMVWGE